VRKLYAESVNLWEGSIYWWVYSTSFTRRSLADDASPANDTRGGDIVVGNLF